jgi:hypothetical protein
MDKVGILCEKDSVMMHEFSRLSLDRIKGHSSLLSVTISVFSSYMEANVKKEVEKDRLIIEESAAAFAAGRPACDLDLEDIFEKTKEVDKKFLDSLMVPSFSFSVHYSDFADIRIQRIWRIARSVYALLGKWPDGAPFAEAAKKAYARKAFNELLTEILHLYTLETRMLGDAIRSPFHKSISTAVEALFQAMEATTEEVASGYTKEIYGEKIIHV